MPASAVLTPSSSDRLGELTPTVALDRSRLSVTVSVPRPPPAAGRGSPAAIHKRVLSRGKRRALKADIRTKGRRGGAPRGLQSEGGGEREGIPPEVQEGWTTSDVVACRAKWPASRSIRALAAVLRSMAQGTFVPGGAPTF